MIKFSTKIRYGLRTLIYLASHDKRSPISIREISANQQIPRKYLESVVQLLKNGSLVRSLRGPEGGYVLALPADKIMMDRVFEVLEGPLVLVECVENKEFCTRTADCIASRFYSTFQQEILEHLTHKTLADVIRGA